MQILQRPECLSVFRGFLAYNTHLHAAHLRMLRRCGQRLKASLRKHCVAALPMQQTKLAQHSRRHRQVTQASLSAVSSITSAVYTVMNVIAL